MERAKNETEISVVDFKSWVGSTVQSPLTAIPLLEGLSSLEFTGAKMILRSHNAFAPEHLAHHAYEEVIHGQIIRDAVRSLYYGISPDILPNVMRAADNAVLATDHYAKQLFSHVSRDIGRRLPKEERRTAYYNLVTYLIEVRLMLIFPAIAKHGCSAEVRSVAKKVIEDEKGHLGYVSGPSREITKTDGIDLKALALNEARLAAEWVRALEHLIAKLRK